MDNPLIKKSDSIPRRRLARVYLKIASENKEKAKLFFENASFQLIRDEEMRLWYVNASLEELKAYRVQWKESPYRNSFTLAFR